MENLRDRIPPRNESFRRGQMGHRSSESDIRLFDIRTAFGDNPSEHRPIKLHQNLIESISFVQYRIRVFILPVIIIFKLRLSIEIVSRSDFDRKRIRGKIRSELKS